MATALHFYCGHYQDIFISGRLKTLKYTSLVIPVFPISYSRLFVCKEKKVGNVKMEWISMRICAFSHFQIHKFGWQENVNRNVHFGFLWLVKHGKVSFDIFEGTSFFAKRELEK